MPSNESDSPGLRRALGLPMLTLYGLGTMIGAGIYALIGEIAGVAGRAAPLSFLIASGVAAFTACSFAELGARFPRAAGAALYVQQGFRTRPLATAVGLMIALSGVVSAAALVNAFHGYLTDFVAVDRGGLIIVAGCVLGAVAAWGIVQSVAVAATITVLEIGGLIWMIGLGAGHVAALPSEWHTFLPGATQTGWPGVFVGVTLAFYAFIGFEDMVDVAEEVRDVRRTLPRGILLTLAIATLLYCALMVTALLALSPAELSATSAPMAALYERNTGGSPVIISGIALFAIINGALIQIVMVARVLYGLSSRDQLPHWFGVVSVTTKTPLNATLVGTAAMIALALAGDLAGLAAATSMIVLTIFAVVNSALVRIKLREGQRPATISFPLAIPVAGALSSAGLVLRELIAAVG